MSKVVLELDDVVKHISVDRLYFVVAIHEDNTVDLSTTTGKWTQSRVPFDKLRVQKIYKSGIRWRKIKGPEQTPQQKLEEKRKKHFYGIIDPVQHLQNKFFDSINNIPDMDRDPELIIRGLKLMRKSIKTLIKDVETWE